MLDAKKLISLEGLSAFKENMDTSIDLKLQDVTVSISQEQGNAIVEKEDGLYVPTTGEVKGIIIKVQANEPTNYTPGLVWIDGSDTVLETSEILYQPTEPTERTQGLGWVG